MDLGKMMKQLQQTQARMAQLQEELAARSVEVTAGGGMIKVVANGRNEILSIKIDPQVIDPNDVEMLEDLVTAAVNEARNRVEEMTRSEMARVAGGLGIPGLPQA
jgi:DNA-binding YbaB/EbfC family protein